MKKLGIFVLLLFSAFFLWACNPGGSEIELDYTEIAPVPTNLAITNKLLTWDDVAEADSYIIYVNGAELTEVNDNQYDFSALSGDVIIFQVQVNAKRGYQDSGLSASLAYVVNRTAEIAAVNAKVEETMGGGAPDGFAEALVDKGMTGDDWDSMITALEDFTTAMDNSNGDIVAMSTAMQTLLAQGINYEAIISAFIIMIPAQLENEIAAAQDEIDYYQQLIDDYGSYYYYEDMIAQYESDIQMYEEIITLVETDPEGLTLAALHTVEYFTGILTQLDTDFFTKVDNIASVDSPTELDTAEVIVVKDELVSAMLDNMPTQQDMVVLFEMIDAISKSVTQETTFTSYPTVNAAQTLMLIEAFARLIDTIDENFVNSIKVFAEDPETFQLEAVILTIKYINIFQIDNDALIQEIRNALTYDQQEAFFNEYLQFVIDSEDMQAPAQLQLIAYEDIYQINDYLFRVMDPLLEWFDETDGHILRLQYDSSSYYNVSYTEQRHYQDLVQIDIMKDVVSMVSLATDEMNDDDLTALAHVLMAMIPYEDGPLAYGTEAQYLAAVNVLKTALVGQMSNIQTLANGMSNYALSSGLFTDMKQMQEDIHDYLITTYGADYRDGYEYYYDNVPDYANAILAAGFIDGYFNSTNKAKLQSVIDAAFAAMKTTDFLTASGMTLSEVNDLQSTVNTKLDDLFSYADTIKNYDAFNLTEAQIANVESFMSVLD